MTNPRCFLSNPSFAFMWWIRSPHIYNKYYNGYVSGSGWCLPDDYDYNYGIVPICLI